MPSYRGTGPPTRNSAFRSKSIQHDPQTVTQVASERRCDVQHKSQGLYVFCLYSMLETLKSNIIVFPKSHRSNATRGDQATKWVIGSE